MRRGEKVELLAPEFDVTKLDGLEGAWDDGALRTYIAGARAGWEKCASLTRPSPSPDVVAVPREELERIANSIEEDVDAIRSDWSDPRPRLKNIRYEIEAIRDIKDHKGSGK